jgi:hypothetical protein
MNILKLTDGVPAKYSEGSLKRDNPQVSFPNPLNERVLADFDCYIYTIDPTPEYNSTLQHVTSFFQQREELWYQAWNVVDFEEDAAKDRLKEQITSDRWDMEQGGVEWLDSNFDLWLIATEENSQVKMTSVLSVLNSNPSFMGYSNWKAEKKVGENWETQFRQTTLEEYNEIIALVSTHIEKCFQAEANCYTKIDSGDLTVTFQSEYNNL